MARSGSRKPPTARQLAARQAFAARARAGAAARRGGGQQSLPIVRGYLPAPASYAMAPPVVQAEFLTAPPPRRAPSRKRRSPMARGRRRQSLTRRASNTIGRARRSLGRAGGGGGGSKLSKFRLKEAAAEAMVETLGGAASATIDEVSKLTENKVDDSILFRLGVKTLSGAGIKWLFNRNKWAVHFAAGMQGDAGGQSLREAGQKLRKKSGG